MKRNLLLVACTIWSLQNFSQTYYPLIEENKTWNVLSVGITGPFPWDTTLSTVSYKVSGDTIVNEISYKKIYCSWEEIPTSWNQWCLMREDEDRKVWMRYKSEASEFLMYDFMLETGDSVMAGEEPVYLYVDSITAVDINGTQREKYWLSCKMMPDYHETWTVGIGSNKGLVWSGSVFLVGGSYWLLCMREGDELIYMNPVYNSCYILSTSVDEFSSGNIMVFPNPAENRLKISGIEKLRPGSITLLDPAGRQVAKFAPGQNELIITGLNEGLYILRILTGNKVIARKIIIE